MNPTPSLHGDDAYRYEDIRINFSSNIFSHADLSGLHAFLCGKMDAISSYPEPYPHRIEMQIAKAEGVDAECVMVGNGATELIYLIADSMGGRTFLTHQPTFAEYAVASLRAGMKEQKATEAVSGDRSLPEELAESASPDLEWICNPNNPDGSVWAKDKLLQHIDSHRGTLFVIDASYEDYTLAPLPTTAELLARENVIAIHSMTKRYCVPGLRLGYAVANARVLRKLRKLQQPWSVNALAQCAAEYLVNQEVSVLPPMRQYLDDASQLRDAINQMDDFEAMPSNTSFFLCKSHVLSASELKEILANRYGILIRDASNFPTLTDRHFRIAAQSVEDNEQLVNALKELSR